MTINAEGSFQAALGVFAIGHPWETTAQIDT